MPAGRIHRFAHAGLEQHAVLINIVIPVKDSLQSKRRLAPVFNQRERARYARYLYRRTLAFFTDHFPREHISVVTPSRAMAAIAKTYGATVILEPGTAGLSAAAAFAAEWSTRHGFDAQLLIPADIAELSTQEIDLLLTTLDNRPSVTVCAATDGGTNALLTSPPDVIDFSFGFRSSRRHLLLARQRGIPCRLLRLHNLSRDIDTPADLLGQKNHFYPLLKARALQ